MKETAVLFLIFNRPDTTERVFEAIRQAKPKRLYVAADGPRDNKEGEFEKCKKTREIATKVDWDCEVKTLFRDSNLGCGRAVSEAISWFFSHEEMGIILEDDCLPHPSFFSYSEELLIKYKDEDRVMMISGDNFQQGKRRGKGSYYFSEFPHIWGWASWRRAWDKYDFKISDYQKFIEQNIIEDIFPIDKPLQDFWIENFNRVYNGNFDTWDYQWVYCILKNGGLSIAPNVNLISNIGFRADATHTMSPEDRLANMPISDIGKISHPDFIIVNGIADKFTRDHLFFLPPTGFQSGILERVYRKIKSKLWK